jgi:hypothetical protein
MLTHFRHDQRSASISFQSVFLSLTGKKIEQRGRPPAVPRFMINKFLITVPSEALQRAWEEIFQGNLSPKHGSIAAPLKPGIRFQLFENTRIYCVFATSMSKASVAGIGCILSFGRWD